MTKERYVFDRFELFPRQRLLLEAGQRLPLGSRALDILTILLEQPGEIIPNDAIVARVWAGVTVEETSLRVHIAAIRKALRDGHDGARFIANVPGRGYSFVGTLQTSLSGSTEPAGVLSIPEANKARTLPTMLTRVIGREDLVELLVEQTAERRLTTIAGPGGIGKTTVALVVARALQPAYVDGVLFVDLSPVVDSASVVGTVAAALNLVLRPEDPVGDLAAALRGRVMLIILDNCEHVVAAVTTLVEGLLRYTDGISILTTSREPLRAASEWVQRVPPLAVPTDVAPLSAADAMRFAAVQLFVERAADTMGGYTLLDVDAPHVVEICRRLDGIALAIEFAASRVDAIAIRDLSMQIGDRFRSLHHGRRTALPRHQTLRAVLDWSYDLLSPAEQTLLARLAVFQGPFSLVDADRVCSDDAADEADIFAGVGDLVAKSLVVVNFNDGRVDYRLLDTTRSYARDKLQASGEGNRLAARHAEHVRLTFEAAAGLVESGIVADTDDTRVERIEDLRAALRWAFGPDGEIPLGVALVITAAPLWSQLSLVDESLEWVQRAIAASDNFAGGDQRQVMHLYAALGGLQMYAISSVKQANSAWDLAFGLAKGLGDIDYQLRALRALWAEAINHGEFARALNLATRFRDTATGTDGHDDLLVADRMIGSALHFLGRHDEAEAAIERMLRLYAVPAPYIEAVRYQFDQRIAARIMRGRILWLRGRTDTALSDITENVEAALALDHTMTLCNVLTVSACPIALLACDRDAAKRYIGILRQRTAARALDVWHTYAVCFEAELAIDEGNVAWALARLRPAMAALERSGFGHYRTSFLMTLARGLTLLGQHDEADARLMEALEACDRTGEQWLLPELHRRRGEIEIGRSVDADAGVATFRVALALAERQGALAWALRAATSLARRLSELGRNAEAVAVLAPIVGRFTEGRQSADLLEATATLANIRDPD
ncbi:ATP-binding protein [Sphingomonas arantia]|uniref:ATP-binding protein n=1 Tax=Sphingomonas arantia TaxID=1460676 RepID=A0ABW4U129_9SPHN